MLMLFIAFFSSLVFAESPNPPRAGRYEGRFTYSYFNTDSNYSSTGNTALVRDGTFTQMQGDFLATYDWQPDWRFSAGFNAAWAESYDGLFTRNNSAMNEIFASAQKWYESGPFDIAPQGDFIFPLWRPDEGADDVLIGEGAMRIRGGAWGFWPLGTYKPFAYLGFEYRDGGRSFLLPYEIGVKFKLPMFWIQGSFRGYESVVDDADSDNQVIREAYLKTVNAGSLKFYSVNPSGSEAVIEAGTNFGAWGVHGGFAITVNGNNSADGWTAYGGMSWSPVLSSKKNDDGFSIRKERYDEELFEDRQSPNPQFVEDPGFTEQPVEDPTVPPPSEPPPEAAPSKPVEMSVELHRVPPKKKKKPVRKKRNKKLDTMMNDAEDALENAH
jgi:hypothetical protein